MAQSYLLCAQGVCGPVRPLGRQPGPGKRQERVLVLQEWYLPGLGNPSCWGSQPEPRVSPMAAQARADTCRQVAPDGGRDQMELGPLPRLTPGTWQAGI